MATLEDGTDFTDIPMVRRAPTLRTVTWRWYDMAIGLTPLVVMRAFPATLADWVGIRSLGMTLLLTLAADAWMLGYPLWVARRRTGYRPRFPSAHAAVFEALAALPAWISMFSFVVVLLIAWSYFLGQPSPSINPFERVAERGGPYALVVLAVMAVVMGPVVEEVFFRGLLYNGLRQRLPVLAAAPIQAVIFGFSHSYGLSHSIFASVLGLALALIYERRRTLLTPILVHALQNLVVTLLAVLALWVAANSPALGITGGPDEGGARLTAVAPGSAADAAGLQPCDVITAVDGKPVTSVGEIAAIVKIKRVGDRVRVEFRRGDEVRRVEVVLQRKGW